MRNSIPLFAVLVICLSSCHFLHRDHVRGDGNVVKQSRNISSFTGIDIGGAVHVILTQDSTYSVNVEIDNNLQPYVEVYNDGSILHIHQRNNTSLDATGPFNVYVSAPSFTSLQVSGASTLRSTNKINAIDKFALQLHGASKADLDLKAPQVKVSLSGASDASVKGETRELLLEASGSSNLEAFELLSENTDVSVSGASHANVYASVKLEADASGASQVRYKGNATVNSNSSGAGSVKKSN